MKKKEKKTKGNQPRNPKKPKLANYHTIIIGAGLAGLVLAKRLAQHNLETLLVDTQEPGIKASLNIEIFTHMAQEAKKMSLDVDTFYSSLPIRLDSMNQKLNEENNIFALKKSGIKFIQGDIHILDKEHIRINDQEYWFKNLVFATGSHYSKENYTDIPAELVISADKINTISRKYSAIAIYGTNAIALELAQAFSNLGTNVYLVDKNVNPFNDFDDEIEAVLKKEYSQDSLINWCLEFEAYDYKKISDYTYRIGLKNDREVRDIEVERIILCDNRVPSSNFSSDLKIAKNAKGALIIDAYFRMKGLANFYAIGEVNGIHDYQNQSYYQADLLANNFISRVKSKIDLNNFCWSLNISPRISFFGMNKKQIEHIQLPYHEFIYDFKGDYKSNFKNDIGRIKIFTSLKHEILGVILIGDDLEEFVTLFSQMKKNKIRFHKLVNFNVPFFTKSEALRNAAKAYEEEFAIKKNNKRK